MRRERNSTPVSNRVEKTNLGENSGPARNKLLPVLILETQGLYLSAIDLKKDTSWEILHEVPSEISGEADKDTIEEVNACDPAKVVVLIMFTG
ncbi:hypothetical protein CDL15_Pgr019217 [Punica granatum]|uniref:Uncharacterized protein n=1 Tax=Punica granatum TaxID=22663 RepID=A0A218W505_PUNGR|nr:hypothetical protein CDL15_Pgr019217 [Punica granatum]PKH69528.1 hypothetical protein CRG98_050105 [Punica granatum]